MHELVRARPLDAASEPRDETGRGGQKLLAAGGLLAALGAASCCILPLALFGLGVTGAWIGNLTALAPYQPLFVAAALGFLALGLWRVYRRPAPACAEGGACAQPRSSRMTKMGLWAAAVLVLAAVTFPYTAPLFL